MSQRTAPFAEALLAIDNDKPTKEQLVTLLDPVFDLLDHVSSVAASLEKLASPMLAAPPPAEQPAPEGLPTGSAPQPTEPEAQAATPENPA